MARAPEIPPRVKPQSDDGYLEQLTKAVFRVGFSWAVIRDKWPGFLHAFEGFDMRKVADYEDADIDRLLSDPAIVRNGRKVTSTIENARVILRLAEAHGSFHGYLRSLDGLIYAQKRKELARERRARRET